MQVICPAPGRKIQAAQYSSSGYLCLHLDQFISNFNADFRFEPDADQVEQRFGAYAGTNPRVTCDCFGDSKQLHGVNYNNVLWVQLLKTSLPPLPGLYFGMMLGLAVWFWVSRSTWKTITVLLSTVIAWLAANFTAEHVFGSIRQMLEEIAAPGKPSMINLLPMIKFTLAVAGVLGGLVGSTILTFRPLARLQRIRSI